MATLRRTETGVVIVGADGYESKEYTYAELHAFVDGVRKGEFDDMVMPVLHDHMRADGKLTPTGEEE